MDAVADRFIGRQTAPGSEWRRWLGAQSIPGVTAAELCDPRSRLVVVAPHPDDEILCCAGLMASHAATRGEVLVVSVTDGEASHGAPDDRMARRRRSESAAGLGQLGVEAAVLSLALPDGEVKGHAVALTSALARLLGPTDTVVSTWQFDGHPDHEATGESVAHACAMAGCTMLAAPVWMWHWSRPGDPRVPWRDMVALGLAVPLREEKIRALRRHGSQLEERNNGEGPVLDDAIVARAAWPSEYFFRPRAIQP